MMQTRKMLSHGPKSIAQPAWQMLYKNGITYTEGQERHDPGETGVYKKDFRKAEVFAAPSVPNIRSNDSTIQVGGVEAVVVEWGGGMVVQSCVLTRMLCCRSR
jgi:hypothetical protein